MRTKSGTQRLLKWIGNGLLVVMLVWTLVPFYWMVATSLKKDKEIYGFEATLVPRQPTLDAYRAPVREDAVREVRPQLHHHRGGDDRRSRWCSAASAPTRSPGCASRGAGSSRGASSFTYLVPPSLLFIPLFAVMSTFRLVDTHHGLVLAYLGFTVPFCTWLLMGYFRSVPLELEEAALVDGCSRMGTLVRIILPDVAPGAGGGGVLLVHPGLERVPVRQVFVSSIEVRTITAGISLSSSRTCSSGGR